MKISLEVMKEIHDRRELILNKPSNNQIIWRYLTLDKFLHLITSQTLYFSPVIDFEDSFEGDYGDLSKRNIHNFFGKEQLIRDKNTFEFFKPHTYISCWHENDNESDAMWKIYGDSIAIKTTFEKISSLLNWKKDEIRHFGRINYVDYNSDEININSSYISYFYKRKSFSHEREVRFLIQNYYSCQYDEYPKAPDGKKLNFNINKCVDEIIFSPLMPSHIIDSVISLLDKYEIKTHKYKSTLLETPTW